MVIIKEKEVIMEKDYKDRIRIYVKRTEDEINEDWSDAIVYLDLLNNQSILLENQKEQILLAQ